MAKLIQGFEFSGVVGRVDITTERAVLRFYPYGFERDLKAKSVLSVVCIGPLFDRKDIDGYDNTEIQEVAIYDGWVEYTAYAYEPNKLRCLSATAEWVPYDTADLMERIVQLEAELEDVSERFAKATRKDAEGLKIAMDLRNRAEIKAQVSADHAERQKAAIAVLKRLITHFQQRVD